MVPEYIDKDRLLVLQLKEGSKDAYQLLFNRYAPRIFAFAMTYLKRREDAEELLQELFLKIWEIRATLDDSKNIKSLLFKIGINLIYDFIRRNNIEQAYLAFAAQNDQPKADSTWHEVIYHDMLLQLKRLVADHA